MAPWVKDPNSGGAKIPPAVQERTKQRLLKYAEANYAGKYTRLDIRFRSQFCYIDAYTEPDYPGTSAPPYFDGTLEEFLDRQRSIPTHLCRLRYFGNENAWAWAFYAYSTEQYKLSMFSNGTFYGTPEDAFEQSAMYLQ